MWQIELLKRFWIPYTWFIRDLLETPTALGCPVEPEVKMTYAKLSLDVSMFKYSVDIDISRFSILKTLYVELILLL